MTLLCRRPREAYRVYSEEEYLDGAGTQLTDIAQLHAAEPELVSLGSVAEWPVGGAEELGSAGELPVDRPESASADERHLNRVAGVAVLVGVTGMVGAVVALNGVWAHTSTGRGAEKLVAAARPRIVRSPVRIASRVPLSRPAVVRSSRPTHPLVRGAWRHRHRHHEGPGLHPPVHLSQPRGSVAIVAADSGPRPSSAEASQAPAYSTPASTVTASTASGSAGPPAEKRPEFGFER